MASRKGKRFLSKPCMPDLSVESPFAYDSGDDDLSLSDDESIPALSDIDFDDIETTNISMGSGSDLGSDVSHMETNEVGTVKSKDGIKWSTSCNPFEDFHFPAIYHGIPTECNTFTSAIGLLILSTECFSYLYTKI